MGGTQPRSWYYFGMGKNTYMAFFLGFVTTLVTVYYLAINSIPFLKSVFPTFWSFAIFENSWEHEAESHRIETTAFQVERILG
jgi:hypothetical protein